MSKEEPYAQASLSFICRFRLSGARPSIFQDGIDSIGIQRRDGNVWEDMSKANVVWLHKTLIGSHKTLDHAKYILSALIITAKTPMRTPQSQWRRSSLSSLSYSCCSCLFISICLDICPATSCRARRRAVPNSPQSSPRSSI